MFHAHSARLKTKKKTSPVSRSGRFDQGPAADVAAFTESVSFDWRLWEHDILGSIAHATMLEKAGLIATAERVAITRGLEQIASEIQSGTFQWQEALEDVHMNIEAELTRRVPAGAKLHTGRSRNDQVALDLRMWLRDETMSLTRHLRDLQRALLQLAERNIHLLMPGYTHLQRAQPVFFSHHLLAYVEMFDRDYERLADGFERLNVCPLGSGALAGSTLPLDREFVARLLGFVDFKGNPKITQNSMDAVGDRDFVVEFCSSAALIAVHLSRLAEDLILWSTAEFNFIRIADAYTTGSSLMPQKRNPDVAELTRGKTGRVIGNLVSVLTVLKGLPMTYNRDFQEDKEAVFGAADTVRATTRLMASMLSQVHVNADRCSKAAADPTMLAADLAEYLVGQNIPFREAHHIVGRVVATAEHCNKRLDQLTLAELRAVDRRFEIEALSVFDLARSMEKRSLPGAPAPAVIRRQLTRWNRLLKPAHAKR